MRVADVFSGAGGLSLGFAATASERRFLSVFALDHDPASVATYNANFGPHAICADLEEFLRDLDDRDFPEADIVIGGPPCQGFSLLNKGRATDRRKSLWRPFIEFVKRSGARAFLIENVPQLLGTEEHGQILRTAQALGFATESARLCAADYGVPQVRHRAFIVGVRNTGKRAPTFSQFPPARTHINRSRPMPASERDLYVAEPADWVTVRTAFRGLGRPRGTELGRHPVPYDLHFGRKPTAKSLARYRAIPDEGMNRFDLQRLAPDITPACWIRKTSGGTDLFGRLWWDRPSVTIRTEFFKPEKGRYLHPREDRPITHREAARLQTFPDDFVFIGSKTDVARQIGNAVPPLLASALADWLYATLTGQSAARDSA